MAVYFIDGDNQAGVGQRGIEWLNETDEVFVFYNTSNTFYRAEKNRNKLAEGTKAAVCFEEIPCAKNSVDFAIAVKAGYLLSQNISLKIFLVSTDNHFDLIARLIRDEVGADVYVRRVEYVWKGVLSAEENLTDLDMIRQILQSVLGSEEGLVLYRKTRDIFEEKAMRQAEYTRQKTIRQLAEPQPQPTPQNPHRQGLFRRLVYGLAGIH